MVALAGSLYLVSTFAFALIALVVGVRLIALGRRTEQLPEQYLGTGLMLTAGFGYGLLIFAMIFARGTTDPFMLGTVLPGMAIVGWVCHNFGVLCMLRFIVMVFHPESKWAPRVAIVMAVVLWSSWGMYVGEGGLMMAKLTTGYWINFSIVGTYPLWVAGESFRYYALMRKRMRLGLAEPLVTNRFLLWGLASSCATASIWTVNIPTFLGLDPTLESTVQLMTVTMLITSFFGIATVAIYWLTFFPPTWYRSRFEGAGSEAPANA